MLDSDFHILVLQRGSYELCRHFQSGLGHGFRRVHVPTWNSHGNRRRGRRADPIAVNNSRAATPTRSHGPTVECPGRNAARSSVLDRLRSDDRGDAAWNPPPRPGMVMVTVSPGRTRTADRLSTGTPGSAIEAEDAELDPPPPLWAVGSIRNLTTSPGMGGFSLMPPPLALGSRAERRGRGRRCPGGGRVR